MYTYTHLEDFIKNLYSKLNIHSPLQLNFYSIADSLGIGVYPINGNSQAIQSDGRQYIFLNNTLSFPEQFEVFAHELGHILLHSDQQSMKKDYREYQEWKANQFALHFCIPTFMLQKLPSQKLVKYKVSKMFNVTEEFADVRLQQYHDKILHYKINKQLQFVAENPELKDFY